MISGGTGSGKTTMLNAMSHLIDPAERVVTIEDAAELQLQQPHVVRLETRPPNLEGTGEITMRDLVKVPLAQHRRQSFQLKASSTHAQAGIQLERYTDNGPGCHHVHPSG